MIVAFLYRWFNVCVLVAIQSRPPIHWYWLSHVNNQNMTTQCASATTIVVTYVTHMHTVIPIKNPLKWETIIIISTYWALGTTMTSTIQMLVSWSHENSWTHEQFSPSESRTVFINPDYMFSLLWIKFTQMYKNMTQCGGFVGNVAQINHPISWVLLRRTPIVHPWRT